MSTTANDLQYNVGGVIAGVSIIELLMNEFITSHYIKGVEASKKFNEQVLETKFFSFELKFQITRRILKDDYPDLYVTFPTSKLKRIQELRNVVAHGRIGAAKREDLDNINMLFFSHSGKQYNAQLLLNEFKVLNEVVTAALLALPGVNFTEIKA